MNSLSSSSSFCGTEDSSFAEEPLHCFFCFKDKISVTEDDWNVESTHYILNLLEKTFSIKLPELNRDEDLFFCSDCFKTWTDLCEGWSEMEKIKILNNTLRKKLAARIHESVLQSQMLAFEPSDDLYLYLRTQIFSSKLLVYVKHFR